jgi:hypothetical protein
MFASVILQNIKVEAEQGIPLDTGFVTETPLIFQGSWKQH